MIYIILIIWVVSLCLTLSLFIVTNNRITNLFNAFMEDWERRNLRKPIKGERL